MIVPDWSAPACVVAAVTTREGGVSTGPYRSLNIATHVGDDIDHVMENRRLLRRACDLPSEPVWLTQVHGNRVVRAEEIIGDVEADAALTDIPDRVCVVQTADCLPVLFCDGGGGRVAAAHAGWAGLLSGVLENTVEGFDRASEVMAWLGPAISQACFEVGPEVRQAFIEAATARVRDRTADAFIPSGRPHHWLADLYELARIRLQPLGVKVFGGGLCTFTDSGRFYSYRRDGTCGRMASLIYIKPG